MRGQFDITAKIVSGGTVLEVTGPVEWDDDERGATIRAWVTQGDVVATGTSAFTPATADTWSATLAAHGGTFHPGSSPARANAKVSLKDGHTEPYPWRDDVDLVD
jgi:hypothetical protein